MRAHGEVMLLHTGGGGGGGGGGRGVIMRASAVTGVIS